MLSAVSHVAAAAGGLLAAEKLGEFAKEAISGAAQLEVQQRRVKAVFGESAEAVTHFSENAAQKFGLSALAAETMTASMGQVLESMGIGKERAAGMSVGLTKMSADLASFTGKKPADVFNALQKGTLGATRGLKQYGINISQTDVANQALAAGIVKPIKNTLDLQNAQIKMRTTTAALSEAIQKHGKGSQEAAKATAAHNNAEKALQKAMEGTVPKLTTAQKSLAAYQLIMKAGAIASGDFGKHSHDLGNEQKILSAEFSNISDEIGAVLLPAVVAAGGALITYVPKGIAEIKGAIHAVQPELSMMSTALTSVASVAGSVFSAIGNSSGAMEVVRGALAGIVTALVVYRTVAAASALATGLMNAAMAAGAAARALFVTTTVAATGATEAQTVAQGELDVAMSANPIGILIVAIAALVAALVLLYRNSQTARAVMDAAWAGIKAGAQAAMNFITQTVIPAAIAAWQRFGPAVVAFLSAAATAIRTAVNAIATVVSTVIGQIKAHWDTIWALFGPAAKAYLDVAVTAVRTTLNVIIGVVKVFDSLLQGDWGGAWNALKGTASAALNGAVSIIKSILGGLAGTVRALANTAGVAIINGLKAGLAGIAGVMAGLVTKIVTGLTGVAQSAYNMALTIGSKIVSGVIAGMGDIASAVGSKLKSGLTSAVGWAGKGLTGSGDFMWTIHTVGQPMAEGIIEGYLRGIVPLGQHLATSLRKVMDQVGPITKENAPKAAAAFKEWGKTAVDAMEGEATKLKDKLKKQLDETLAKIDAWKAKLTPAEVQLKATQAISQLQQLQGALDKAWDALKALPQKQADAMTSLIAEQKKGIDAMRAAATQPRDDAVLANTDFNNALDSGASGPAGRATIDAQQNFNRAKADYDAGLADQATFVAAYNALNAQKAANEKAISDASAAGENATEQQKTAAAQAEQAKRLLDLFNTATTANQQEAAANAAILTQEQVNADARKTLQDTFNQQTLDATTTKDTALQALLDDNLEKQATKERTARDKEAEAFSHYLTKKHERFVEHLDNQVDVQRKRIDTMVDDAGKGGKNLVESMADGLRKAIPTLNGALAAVAARVAAYLKVQSPTELGPMSDLDRWWKNLGPTLTGSFDTSGMRAKLTEAMTPYSTSIGGPTGAVAARNRGWDTSRMEDLLRRIEKHTGTSAAKPPGIKEIHVSGGVSVDASVYRSRR